MKIHFYVRSMKTGTLKRFSAVIFLLSILLTQNSCSSFSNAAAGSQTQGYSKSSAYSVKKESNKIQAKRVQASKTPGSSSSQTGGSFFKIPGLFAVTTTFDGKGLFLLRTIKVKNSNVTINVWDDGAEDGDIISLYVNNTAVVSQYSLKNQKTSFSVSLEKTNKVYLYAHDMGKYPPCTAAFEIIDGKKSENFTLSADLENSQGIEVIVE